MSQIATKVIQLEKFGVPHEVLELKTIQLDTNLGSNQVLIKWLASPVNPTDINQIQGDYNSAMPAKLPLIPGSEGIGVVEKVGSNVTHLKPGDSIISVVSRTKWNEYSVADATGLFKIDSRLDLVNAATLAINPPTAYVMLKEFVDLKPGDVIIQNSANSGVGRSVIQLAKAFDVKTINLIRSRPNVDELKNELKELGADWVFTEDEFRTEKDEFVKNLNAPIRLALDGVGGKSSLLIANALGPNGYFLIYGAMSGNPQSSATFELPFLHIGLNRIKVAFVGIFNFVLDPNWQDKAKTMFDEIQALILDGRFKPTPVEVNDIENFKEAVKKTLERKGLKQLLLLHPDAKKKL